MKTLKLSVEMALLVLYPAVVVAIVVYTIF
jgi:hypothetical protein